MLERHVRAGGRVVVGLSGGRDSVSLLHVLASLRHGGVSSFVLSALHVNHGLSSHADEWEALCRRVCAALSVPIETRRVNVERASADGLEAAARRARHEVFAAAAADVLMLAHHRDDQAETLLFNLVRGTGLSGAAAMRDSTGRLLRPWLSVERATISAYAVRHRLVWCEDESNADIRHTRNFLRHAVLPLLEQRFPAAAKNIAAASRRFGTAQELLDQLARIDLGGEDARFPIEVERLMNLSGDRARNALRYLLYRQGAMIPSEARLCEGLRQMLNAAEDRHPVVVFGRYRLRRRQGLIYLEAEGVASESR